MRSGVQAFGGGPARRQGAQSEVDLGYRSVRPAGPEGTAGGGVGRGRCGVPLTLQLPRTLARPSANTGQWPPPQLRRTGARALDGKATQPFGAAAGSEARRVRPQGHLAGRGKPSEGPSMRSGEGEAKCGKGACAV